MHGPIRYDKNTDKAPKLTGYDTGGLDALGDKLMKGAPKGVAPGGNDNAKDPSLLEGIGKAAAAMRAITKAPLDAAVSQIPGVNAAAKIPGKLYEGAAHYVPNAIKDARVAGYRVGDAVDAAAQTFSPVSLDPNATPADHAEQAALAWSGGKLLGKAAGALGKHGGKIVDGIGLGTAFGPDAVSGAADHAARMFGREVPSLAAAGEARALSPRALLPREVNAPQVSQMAAGGPGRSWPGAAWDGVKGSAGWVKGKTWDQLPRTARAQATRRLGDAAVLVPLAGAGLAGYGFAQYMGRKAAEAYDRTQDDPITRERINNIGKNSERMKKQSADAYREAAEYLKQKRKKNAEREAADLKRKQQGAN